MRIQPLTAVIMVGALVGLVFASFATYDFAQHLDREVHSVHCSFVPGLSESSGEDSGCKATLMSPYSSVFRTLIWGGIPISLPAMSVFAFVLFFAAELFITGRQRDPRATGFLALATGLPAAASLVMGIISFGTLGAACKLCVGIYIASAACLGGALVLWRRAARADHEAHAAGRDPSRATWEGPAPAPGAESAGSASQPPEGSDPAWATDATLPAGAGNEAGATGTAAPEQATKAAASGDAPRTSYGYLAGAFGIGVAFVALPVITYAATAPDHSEFIGTCGSLDDAEKEEKGEDVLVPLGEDTGGVPAVEVIDPLCPACRGFARRLEASGLAEDLDRRMLLFPLDDTCNWMVDDALHPGACTVSEAVLCAGERADEVLAWSFSEQEKIRRAEREQEGSAEALVAKEFPELSECVGSSQAQSRLNRSLRWAVSNQLQVLTPQLFVDGVRVCDQDTDLGLEYTLSRLLTRYREGELAVGGEP